MKFIGIIPSRYASSRFPGKPLVDVGGKMMVQRVYEQVSQAGIDVYVATDDERIKQAVINFGGKVILTSVQHQSGTDRVAEALEKIEEKTGNNYDVAINVQGDEPFIKPQQVMEIQECFNDPDTQLATLIKKIDLEEDILDPKYAKIVLNKNGEAIYFSRSPIPYLRDAKKGIWKESHDFYKHISVYAYRKDVLKEITQLPPSLLEKAESLEQLRWIENGYRIKTAVTEWQSPSVDTPEDLQRILASGII